MRHKATEGRSAAAPVQGGRACRGAARVRPHRAARLRPYRGAVGRGNEAWFTKGVVNVPSANTTRERNS